MIVDRTIHIAHVGQYGVNRSPWVHLNLQDLSPPGHDLLTVLHDPKGRRARIDAWAAALRTFDKGLLYVKGLRNGAPLSGVSFEGEQVVPVPHYTSMMHYNDGFRSCGLAIEHVLRVIANVMGVHRVIPYGSAQVLPVYTAPKLAEHKTQRAVWYDMHAAEYGSLRGIPPCQSVYLWDDWNDIDSALNRHYATGRISKSKPLTVFIAPIDDNARWQLRSLTASPVPCRVVSWHKCDTAEAAKAGADAVRSIASDIGLTIGCEVAND